MISSVALVCACVLPSTIDALTITEIMFDAEGSDVGHEWVALYNDTAVAVPLTTWRMVVDGKRHKIREGAGGSSLPPATTAIIADDAARYLSDHSGYTGLVYESSFALPNDGALITIVDENKKVVAEKSYHAAPKQTHAEVITPQKVTKKSRSKETPTTIIREQTDTDSDTELVETSQNSSITSTSTSQTAASAMGVSTTSMWMVGASMLGLVGVGAALTSRKKQKDEWHIADLSDDAV